MLEAVLFDWTNTLVQFTWDDDLLVAGHRGGSGGDRRATTAGFTERLPRGRARAPRGPATTTARAPPRAAGPSSPTRKPTRFMDAEHAVWRPAHAVLGPAQALLESLRGRGLKTGDRRQLVARAGATRARRRRRVRRSAIGSTSVVFSSEVGVRKPDPAIFLRALEELDVDPLDAMFVGDRLVGGRPGGREPRDDDGAGAVVQRGRRRLGRSSRTSWPSRRWTC